jgi:hypothetical protein
MARWHCYCPSAHMVVWVLREIVVFIGVVTIGKRHPRQLMTIPILVHRGHDRGQHVLACTPVVRKIGSTAGTIQKWCAPVGEGITIVQMRV